MHEKNSTVHTPTSSSLHTDQHDKGCTLLWLRHDLRIQDQPTLQVAVQAAQSKGHTLLAVYFFEPRFEASDHYGTPRMGVYRAQFILETLSSLQQQFRSLGGDLLVLHADPSEELLKIARFFKVEAVYASHHVADEEVKQESLVAYQLNKLNVPLCLCWSHTLFSQSQLPFPLGDLPDIYTQFRKKIERYTHVSKALSSPQSLPQAPPLHTSSWSCQLHALKHYWQDQLDQYGVRDKRGPLLHQGGSLAGEQRLDDYFWQSRSIEQYKETRNGLIGDRYSTQLSPWLSVGALSPKWIWHETLRYEDERIANDSTYWVRFELLWREYFQWVAYLYGAALFKPFGLSAHLQRSSPKLGRADFKLFHQWANGDTGNHFIDANMRELNLTGFMSNRGRQNVASYLIHDLGVDWRMGAGYFESKLIDYDPASNWGNWAYIAGVGNDPRPQRKFNTRSQANRYDANGEYRSLWLN